MILEYCLSIRVMFNPYFYLNTISQHKGISSQIHQSANLQERQRDCINIQS